MDDYALVLNAGSSSLKFCVFQRPAGRALAPGGAGQVEGIGSSPRLSAKGEKGEVLANQDVPVRDGRDAVDALAGWLRSKYGGARVVGVGHRVVHGGARFTGPTVLNPQVLAELRDLIPLAPLHQPYNLLAIEAATERLPGCPAGGLFRHQFPPRPAGGGRAGPAAPRAPRRRAAAVRLSRVVVRVHRLRPAAGRPGDRQGPCHRRPPRERREPCALRDGKSVESTLGFTALDGLCMGTRPGALDPGVVLHLFQGLKMSAKDVETLLYKKCGLLGISGISNDMRDLLGRPEPEARLAVDYFVYRAAKEIGALAAVLRGVDAIVFTAGIGENSAEIRQPSARRPTGSASRSIRTRTPPAVRGSPCRRAKSRPGSSPRMRN